MPTLHGDVAASADLEVAGAVPIGGIIAYAGSALPGGTVWDWADGALIDKTVYATLFARIAHDYNGGVDPLSNKVRKPDKRGRVSMGADAFGQGAAARITVASAIKGANGGEERHTTTTAEIPAHSHTASSGTESVDHTHSGSTDAQGSHNHGHASGGFLAGSADAGGGGFFAASGGGGAITAVWWGGSNTVGAHAHNFSTGGRSAAHTHAITVNNSTGGGGAHQNLQLYEADYYLVRIA